MSPSDGSLALYPGSTYVEPISIFKLPPVSVIDGAVFGIILNVTVTGELILPAASLAVTVKL